MPFSGVSVNNPQEQNPLANLQPTTGGIVFGGNALGTGASTATTASASDDLSTILLYGGIALAAIWILQRLDD